MNTDRKIMKVGDLFAGVGGFSLGFIREGCSLSWAVEWDKTCQKVLRHQHPETKVFGDITKVDPLQLDDVDIIIGGSPCQDLSVAGKRKGLEGERSGLFHEFIRLVRAKQPAWVVWENVPGALSSNGGRDFAVVLGEMADSGYPDIAYRVLDARHFGVAQRRRRVFVVASRQAVGGPSESRSARVLGLLAPIRAQQESVRRHIEACRAEGKAPPPIAERGSRAAGGSSRIIHAQDFADPLLAKEGSTWTHEGCNNFRTHNLSIIEKALSEGGEEAQEGKSKFFQSESGGKWWNGEHLAANLTTRCHDQFMPDKSNFAAVIQPVAGAESSTEPEHDEVLAIRTGHTKANGIGVGDTAYTLDGASPQAIMQPGDVQALAFQPRFFTRDNKTGNKDSCNSETVSPLMARMIGDSADHVAVSVPGLPQAYSIREDAVSNNFSATPLEVANALQALQAAPSSHHAQTYITDLLPMGQSGANGGIEATGKDEVNAVAYDGMNQKLEPEVHHALRTGKDSGDCVIDDVGIFRKSARAQSNTDDESWVPAEHSNTLNRFDVGERDTHAIVELKKEDSGSGPIGFTATQFAKYGEGCGTLRANGGDLGGGSETIIVAKNQDDAMSFTCSEQSNSFAWEKPDYPTITAQVPNDTSNLQQGVRCGMVVRRLTPVECCILMGWPHNWNEFGADENGVVVAISDAQRYKQCGNGVVSNCSQWIAAGILNIDEE